MNQGRADMNPFSRPASGPTHNGAFNQGHGSMGGHNGSAAPTRIAGDISKWRQPSSPLVGFDAGSVGTFLSNNKIAVSVAVAAIVGGLVYHYGYR